VNNPARDFWLVDANPHNLPEPPQWWQRMVLDYDKMLRLMPSQTDRAYRLCRLVRAQARLGLKAAVIHTHPDTTACIRFGIVPIMTLVPDAVHSANIIATLRSRDLWGMHGGDPHKIVDALEADEAAREARENAETAAWQDEILSDSYRHVKEGFRPFVQLPAPSNPLRCLPQLPSELPGPLARRLQNRVPSVSPPTASPAAE